MGPRMEVWLLLFLIKIQLIDYIPTVKSSFLPRKSILMKLLLFSLELWIMLIIGIIDCCCQKICSFQWHFECLILACRFHAYFLFICGNWSAFSAVYLAPILYKAIYAKVIELLTTAFENTRGFGNVNRKIHSVLINWKCCMEILLWQQIVLDFEKV